MSVFDIDGMERALDWMVPAPSAKIGMENEIKHAQGAQNRRGLLICASTRNRIYNLVLGEEDNLAEVAQANVLTEERTMILTIHRRTTRKRSLTQHCENTSLGPVVRLDPLS
jgi:hypothetical protein